eukprot:4976781-Alexandrium_andersonii.AAC.1
MTAPCFCELPSFLSCSECVRTCCVQVGRRRKHILNSSVQRKVVCNKSGPEQPLCQDCATLKLPSGRGSSLSLAEAPRPEPRV